MTDFFQKIVANKIENKIFNEKAKQIVEKENIK